LRHAGGNRGRDCVPVLAGGGVCQRREPGGGWWADEFDLKAFAPPATAGGGWEGVPAVRADPKDTLPNRPLPSQGREPESSRPPPLLHTPSRSESMPEGPEIRRTADRLAKAVGGKRLASAWFAFPALKRFEKSLPGAVIESITPHGKALLTRFDNGWTLYSHNQLYGVWRIAEAGERPDTKRSLRVALETSRKAILLYSASDVAMWRSDELHRH